MKSDNTTTMGLFMFSFTPMFELQMMMSDPSVEITCPEIQGEFPEDGLPTEPVIVTGNGCTNDAGVTYDGSFVYSDTRDHGFKIIISKRRQEGV